MELLRRMAAPGATVHTWTGIRSAGGAYIDYHAKGEHKTEKVNQGTVSKFCDWGWLDGAHRWRLAGTELSRI